MKKKLGLAKNALILTKANEKKPDHKPKNGNPNASMLLAMILGMTIGIIATSTPKVLDEQMPMSFVALRSP